MNLTHILFYNNTPALQPNYKARLRSVIAGKYIIATK